MKSNSDLLENSVENSYLFDEGLLSKTAKEKVLIDFSQGVEIKRIKNSNFLTTFWNRLIFKPQTFSQKPNTSIGSILEEEKGKLETCILKSVLSKKLELSMNSTDLSIALDKSIKIFHEDYPWDFILEYNGERLGMVLLDICYNLKKEAVPIYRFNPHIKSFQGIF